MANYLNFDGVGRVSIPSAIATGDFTIEFSSLLFSGTAAFEMFLSQFTSTLNWLSFTNTGKISYYIGGVGTSRVFGSTGLVNYKIQRVGTTLTQYVNGFSIAATQNSNQLTLDNMSGYNNGAYPYFGEMHGTLTMTGFTGGLRTYNFGVSLGTNLVDTSGAQNGTLIGFNTGGLVAEGGAVDTVPPVITILGNNPETVVLGNAYVDAGATALDNVDGNITANIVSSGSVNTSLIGAYNVTYNVSDAAGNPAVAVTRVVNVVSQQSAVVVTSPTNYQCKQRDLNGNASFTLSGSHSVSSLYEYSIDNGVTWVAINAVSSINFSKVIVINGQVDLIVRVVNDNTTKFTVLKVTSALGIAEGPSQSNGEGQIINNQVVTLNAGDPVPIMYKNGVFSILSDSTSPELDAKGSLWPLIASKYANNGVPVCVANVAVGGTSILSWGVGGILIPRIEQFGNEMGGIEIITSLIGEYDSTGTITTAAFKAGYLNAVQGLSTTYNSTVYCTYFPIGAYLNGFQLGTSNVRSAFDQLIAENTFIKFGGDLSVINIDNDVGGDGLHIKSDVDAIEGANIRYNAFVNSSTLNMSITNVPNGLIDTRVIDVITKKVVYSGQVNWLAGVASLNVNVQSGTQLEYYVITLTDAGVNKGGTA